MSNYKSALNKITDSFAQDRAMREQAQEELKTFRQEVFDNPVKFVDHVLKDLVEKQQNGVTHPYVKGFGLNNTTELNQVNIVASQHGRDLLVLLKELQGEARDQYTGNVGRSYYDPEKKEICNKALEKYHLFGHQIKRLEQAL